MLGDSSSSVLATTATASSSGGGGDGGGGEGAAPPPVASGSDVVLAHEEEKGIGRSGGGGGDEGDRSFGGNRWPRQETLALLKIRSDMDVAFRDASVKGPLWEEVSRKLAELGYNRNAKKCKEKFENVYKYHKRTKEGRTGKQEGKTYRFFDQLEAFESTHSSSSSVLSLPPPPPPSLSSSQQQQQQTVVAKHQNPVAGTSTISMSVANVSLPPSTNFGASHVSTTVPSTAAAATTTTTATATLATNIQGIVASSIPSFPSTTNPTPLPQPTATNPTINIPTNIQSSLFSPDLISNDSTSSSTSSDVELQGRHKRKRKWKDFFERLMKEVIHKQEEMQRKFLEAIEKREHERLVREESWKMQEVARINREREILAQERSIAAAKDAAVMAFLQKLSEQQNPAVQVQNNPQQQPVQSQQPPSTAAPPPTAHPPQPTPVPPQSQQPPQPLPLPAVDPAPLPVQPAATTTGMEIVMMKSDNGVDQNFMGPSSSRWPKVEVQALIKMRTNLDSKYQENGPKGPLWEEISAGMRKLGYNRSAKRCKEKWENINKYFKKVKESNKKRREDSKTCPYFSQLDALYKEKSSKIEVLKPENTVPLMVRPEQQWPPAPQQEHRPDSGMDDDMESDQNDDDNEDDDEDEAGGYEIVATSKAGTAAASVSAGE